MKLKFLGAAGTVTGSSYALTQDEQSILVDMGMFQGPKKIDDLNYQPFDFDVSNLNHVLLTHAHLDHCGRLPLLPGLGFSGQILMTQATLDLVELVLFDSAKIAKMNPKGLYDKEAVEQTLELCRVIKYDAPVNVGKFEAVFRNASHLLGAASIELTSTHGENKGKKIVFSGDLGNPPNQLLPDPVRPKQADIVVIESTYGDRLHSTTDPSVELEREINAVEATGNTLLIPAFSLQKTQELLFLIKHLSATGRIQPTTPIFLDSPMATKATDIYRHYRLWLNNQTQREFHNSDVFDFPQLQVVFTNDHSQAIQELPGSKVIIAGGGMMTGGRIVSHAAYFLPDPKNRIFFVGFQGEETLGREILEGNSPVVINKKEIEVKANIEKTESMSGHADQDQLIEWLADITGVKQVIITHGEDVPRQVLAERIKNDLKVDNIYLPNLNQELNF